MNEYGMIRHIWLTLIVIVYGCGSTIAQSNTFPASGSVGIGTLYPDLALHVQGSGIRVVNGSGWGGEILPTGHHETLSFTTNLSYSGSGSPEGNMNYIKGSGSWASGGALLYLKSNSNTSRGLYFYTAEESTGAGTAAVLTERFRIQHGGVASFLNTSVGIGTTNPGAKLAVNGDIKTKEIVVTDSSEEWPDYVFDPDYPLPGIDQVDEFIRREGHLPGIPSAEQIQESGQNLGEIQVLLLKKIEELTLYVISMKKDSAQQINIVNQQQESIKTLQDQLNRLCQQVYQKEILNKQPSSCTP